MQKGESQNGSNKNTKHAKFSEKRTFFTPGTHTYVCVSGGKKRSFFGKFGVLCILVTSVLRFVLLPYYRRLLITRKNYPILAWRNVFHKRDLAFINEESRLSRIIFPPCNRIIPVKRAAIVVYPLV